jgi:hypothetical protein
MFIAVMSLGIQGLSDQEISELFKPLDRDESGKLDWSEISSLLIGNIFVS